MRIADSNLKTTSMLILSQNPASVFNISEHLALSKMAITRATSTSDAETALELDKPDVVLLVDSSQDMLEWLINLKHQNPKQVVTIFVTKEQSEESIEVDLVIPPDHLPKLDLWLRSYLRLYKRLIKAESRNRQLKSENDHLKEELSARQQSANDIGLLRNSIVHSVSHELRTPLLQVKSAVSLLAEEAGSNSKIIDLALEATTRLEGGVRNVTLLNELMNETLNTQSFAPTELETIVQSAIRNLRRSWEHKHHIERIQVEICDSAAVLADRQRLIIAIQLLLDNALKFSESEVKLTATNDGDQLKIAILDKGIGIPAEHLSHIFEPFYQVDGSSTRRFGGMGIGLAIVHYILEYHQTQIQVTTAAGEGSAFTFSLPIAPQPILID
jgi:signal transduction histidine kinase